jgi:hypothetical protein
MGKQGIHEDSPSGSTKCVTFDLAHGYESFTAFCAEVMTHTTKTYPHQFDDDELQAMDASMSFCEPVGTDPTNHENIFRSIHD